MGPRLKPRLPAGTCAARAAELRLHTMDSATDMTATNPATPRATAADAAVADMAVSGSRRARRSRAGIAGLFMTTGVLHFLVEKEYTATVPGYLPNGKQLVYLSGVAEFAGGAGVLFPRTRRLAGLGLLGLLVAVYPANINMALHSERWPKVPAWSLWGRLPLQFAAMIWVNAATKKRD